MKEHVYYLSDECSPRSYQDLNNLNKSAKYIYTNFEKYADTVFYQRYQVDNIEYKNVIALFGNRIGERLIIGAHYDAFGNYPGADDNASGVAGLLELARLFHQKSPEYQVELVAYTLEEPPFFRTEKMGSYVHAKDLYEKGADVRGMVCLEMIGYFDDSKKSQDYPIGLLNLFYGNRGDYITLVKKFGSGKFARKFTSKFRRHSQIKAKKFKGPASLSGIDFSDHLNYWKFGFSALMITDTAFYRNKNYHKSSDTADKLNYDKMAKIINTVYQTVVLL